ncbi:MAG TPA: hypothetical protein VK000_09605 [Luteimonas sp.]|nr:hypothetical protein [Luteimonas sp.]
MPQPRSVAAAGILLMPLVLVYGIWRFTSAMTGRIRDSGPCRHAVATARHDPA